MKNCRIGSNSSIKNDKLELLPKTLSAASKLKVRPDASCLLLPCLSLLLSTETRCLALAVTSTVMRLFVRYLPQPDPIEIQCHTSDTVGHIKASLAHRLSCSISRLRLVFGGRELDQDFEPLTEIGINNESSLSAVLSPGSFIALSISLSRSLAINN